MNTHPRWREMLEGSQRQALAARLIAYAYERRWFRGKSLKIIERFTRIAPDTVVWSVTLDDPHTWTRPWTWEMNLSIRDASQQPFEYACHEGNYGMRNMLNAARQAEKATAGDAVDK